MLARCGSHRLLPTAKSAAILTLEARLARTRALREGRAGGGNRLCPSPSLGPRTWRQLQLNVCVQCMPITQCGVWEGTCDNAIFVDGESVRRQVGGLSAKQQLWHGNVGKQLMNDGCCARLSCRRYKIVRWSRYMFLCHRACVLSPTSSPP